MFACETALKDFQIILQTVGGPHECHRAGELLADIQIVPDDPSERAMGLSTSAKVKHRAKVSQYQGQTQSKGESVSRSSTEQR